MAVFDYPAVPKNGALRLEDATGTPIAVTTMYDMGNCQYDDMSAGYLEKEILQIRGLDTFVVETQEERIGFSFDCVLTDVTDGTDKLVRDACMKTGAFASGVSTLGANKPWALKLTWTLEQTSYGASTDSTIVFAKVLVKHSFAEGIPGKLSIKGVIFNPSSTVSVT